MVGGLAVLERLGDATTNQTSNAAACETQRFLLNLGHLQPTFSVQGSNSSLGRPSAFHLAQPPSSSSAEGWPATVSIHHSRAAIMPSPESYACYIGAMTNKQTE
jgi:hypothetical protein